MSFDWQANGDIPSLCLVTVNSATSSFCTEHEWTPKERIVPVIFKFFKCLVAIWEAITGWYCYCGHQHDHESLATIKKCRVLTAELWHSKSRKSFTMGTHLNVLESDCRCIDLNLPFSPPLPTSSPNRPLLLHPSSCPPERSGSYLQHDSVFAWHLYSLLLHRTLKSSCITLWIEPENQRYCNSSILFMFWWHPNWT